MCDHFGPNPRTKVKPRSLFSLLTLLSIVDVARGGRGSRWRSERMHRVGARAARYSGRCGRHERAIYSPARQRSNMPKMDVLRKMSYQQNSHGCPAGCRGVRRTGSDIGANVSTKERPPRPIYVNGAWSFSTLILGTSEHDGADHDCSPLQTSTEGCARPTGLSARSEYVRREVL